MTAGPILLFAMLGAGVGALHFAAISRDVDLLADGGSVGAMIGLRLGRLLMTVAVLAISARQGWPALLAATFGFMVARQIVLRRLGTAR